MNRKIYPPTKNQLEQFDWLISIRLKLNGDREQHKPLKTLDFQ